jgi:beta-lactamase superfamily II metal-dependent hydrolase
VLALVSAFMVAGAAALSAEVAPRTLDIYRIDVEGGAATLVVTPSGESMLVDTGCEADGRDARRIFAAAQKAGLQRLDHVVICGTNDARFDGMHRCAATTERCTFAAVHDADHLQA